MEDALETQVVVLAGETQPLDDIDEVEDINSQLLVEVFLDRDGERTDSTQVLDDVDDLYADDAHYNSSGHSEQLTMKIHANPFLYMVRRNYSCSLMLLLMYIPVQAIPLSTICVQLNLVKIEKGSFVCVYE